MPDLNRVWKLRDHYNEQGPHLALICRLEPGISVIGSYWTISLTRGHLSLMFRDEVWTGVLGGCTALKARPDSA